MALSPLAALASFLESRTDDLGAWSVRSEEVMRVLRVEPVEFWRALHAVGARISFSDAIDGWTQDTVGDLVTFLEALLGPAAEVELARAGLFIPHESGIELTEALLTSARRFCAGHEILGDELEAMIRYKKTVRGAVELYCTEHADIDALIELCAEAFRTTNGLPEIAAATAARYLRRMFACHVLSREALLALLAHRLRVAAADRGFVDPEERPRGAHSAGGARGGGSTGGGGDTPRGTSYRRAWALRVMGLDESSCGADALRERYRAMMMRFHPDVDPQGLERCKDVNVAYALLIAEAIAEQ
jgi:hypothetical protein